MNWAEEGLALERHFLQVLRVRVPLVPLIADHVITVEDSHPIDTLVFPTITGVGNGLGKYQR